MRLHLTSNLFSSSSLRITDAAGNKSVIGLKDFTISNFSANGSDLTNGSTSAHVYNGGVPDSLSIVDVDSALAFSEKISFGARQPDSLSIGRYSQIKNWSYYDALDSELGRSTEKRDLGFCLYYDLGDLSQDSTISFNYGIANTETDSNLANVPITENTGAVEKHSDVHSVWIQSGSEAGARRAMEATKGALQKVSANRAKIGAQQNLLEIPFLMMCRKL